MIKELYRLRLVLILAVIAVLMGVTRFRYRNYQWEQPPIAIEISPTLAPSPTSGPQGEVIYPLVKLLPYKGNGFIVDSYAAPKVLIITTSGNIKTVTKEIYKWMEKNKVATESHKLIFQSP